MKTSTIPLTILLAIPAITHAALTPVPYAGVAYERQRITVDETDFDTDQLILHAGAWLWEGVGLELEFGKALSDNKKNTVSLEHTSMLRYGFRLMTPPTVNKTVLYVLLGGVSSSLDMQTSGDGIPGTSRFSGYHAGVGIGTQINTQMQLDISYNDYQVDKNIDISGFRLNFEYNFGAAKQ